MADSRDDRRAQRSRRLLQQALMSLVAEKRFDKITVQDIIERADVGRTTFYAHFEGKEQLFLSTHDRIIQILGQSFFDAEGNWLPEPAPEIIFFLGTMQDSRGMHFYLTFGTETGGVHRPMKERIAGVLEAYLRDVFDEGRSAIPFEILAHYVAGSTISMMTWWMDKRTPHTGPEMARMVHQMNSAVLRAALDAR
jgi:AcrR family transcriptional regulator